MQTSSHLGKITIVLVDVKSPANIGAVARCMMNMGLSRLVLVRPPKDPDNLALKLAAGADGILKEATHHAGLSDAIGDQNLVFGASRHSGRLRKNIMTPRDAASTVIPLLEQNSVSLVFGNEVNGLDRQDLALCNEFVSIPSSDAFPSLNLSHAVMVVAYELFAASLAAPVFPAPELAAEGDLEHFYSHLETGLKEIGFLDHGNSERMMFSLRQIFGRARLEPRELSILHGIITAFLARNRGK